MHRYYNCHLGTVSIVGEGGELLGATRGGSRFLLASMQDNHQPSLFFVGCGEDSCWAPEAARRAGDRHRTGCIGLCGRDWGVCRSYDEMRSRRLAEKFVEEQREAAVADHTIRRAVQPALLAHPAVG